MKLSMGIKVHERALPAVRPGSAVGEVWQKTGKARQGWFLQLIPMLQRARAAGTSTGGVFAFTAANSGEGVSFVVQAVARQLAEMPGERVLITNLDALGLLSPKDVLSETSEFIEIEPNIWTAPEPAIIQRRAAVAASQELLSALRRQFSFVLLDCRALRVSPEVLRLAPYTEGVLLVVAAGDARREQVEQVQRVIQIATTKLLGCILNKRTYPVPDALYKRL